MEKEEVKHPLGKRKLSFGRKAADTLTKRLGSWAFILFVFVFVAIWMFFNVLAFINHWDPYPFILLNFVLSCLAAIQAPIILMSQNRESERDRLRAEYDYQINKKAEREIESIQKDLKFIKQKLIK